MYFSRLCPIGALPGQRGRLELSYVTQKAVWSTSCVPAARGHALSGPNLSHPELATHLLSTGHRRLLVTTTHRVHRLLNTDLMGQGRHGVGAEPLGERRTIQASKGD